MRQGSRFAGRYRLQERLFTELHILKFITPRDEERMPKMWECGEAADKKVALQNDILICSQQLSEWRTPCYHVGHETGNSSRNSPDAHFMRAQSTGAGSSLRSRG
jgi:hypothetical protein